MPTTIPTLPQDSEHWQKCARHTNKRTSRNVAYLYLCDPCTEKLIEEALNGRPPIYHGETVEGYCGLCNERKDVTFRQWFACPVCWNVVSAYQKATAPPLSLREFWEEHVRPVAPAFHLEETDEVFLSPYVRGGKTKRQKAETLESADFLVSEEVSPGDRVDRFHIELKAGPGSIDTMREFQLDVNDYHDIVGVARTTGLPVYVVHVQLGFRYDPPTQQTHAVKMWWTDVATLWDHMKRVDTRRDEAKQALYFKPAAFQPMETFPAVVTERRFEALREKLLASPPEYVE